MQRGLRKIMALSRSPIELTKKRSAVIGLQSAKSLLFIERISYSIRARFLQVKKRIMKRPNTCLYCKMSLINDLKEGILSYLERVSNSVKLEAYLQVGENDV